MAGEPAGVECILIADDLTGACDTGVQFVRRGLSCRVELNLPEHRAPAMTDVLAFNTSSRGDSLDRCRQKIEKLAIGCSHLRAKVIFKKIDSTLRGNVGEEIATVLRTFKCEAAIIAPAFPAMCRLVRDGTLHWSDGSGNGQIEIMHLLARQGIALEKVALLKPGRELVDAVAELNTLLMNGRQIFIVDCESQDDLHFTVTAATQIPRKFLWVGSAGLGMALAGHMAKSQSHKSVPAIADSPMLFVIGSTHPATLRQKQTLLAVADTVEVGPSPEAIGAARQALHGGRHLVVTVEESLAESSLRRFFAGLEGLRLGAMFLTGGDTGALVCNVIGGRSIDLHDEIMPGLPWGILAGGMFHGLPVASKSGSFGNEDVLVRCAEFFAPARSV